MDAFAEEDDFAPVFELLEAAYRDQKVNDIGDDEWAEPFIFRGQELVHIADSLSSNSSDEAINFYM